MSSLFSFFEYLSCKLPGHAETAPTNPTTEKSSSPCRISMPAEIPTNYKGKSWQKAKTWCVFPVNMNYNGPFSTRSYFVPCVESSKAVTNLEWMHNNHGNNCYQIQCIAKNVWEKQQSRTTQSGHFATEHASKDSLRGILLTTCCPIGKHEKAP